MRRPEIIFASPGVKEAAARLGGAVRAARLGRNLTQADFAERARVSLATLQRIERGDPAVSFTSWLSALEAGSLLPLLNAASDPNEDAVGRVQRRRDQRQRASKPRPAPAGTASDSDADTYAF